MTQFLSSQTLPFYIAIYRSLQCRNWLFRKSFPTIDSPEHKFKAASLLSQQWGEWREDREAAGDLPCELGCMSLLHKESLSQMLLQCPLCSRPAAPKVQLLLPSQHENICSSQFLIATNIYIFFCTHYLSTCHSALGEGSVISFLLPSVWFKFLVCLDKLAFFFFFESQLGIKLFVFGALLWWRS